MAALSGEIIGGEIGGQRAKTPIVDRHDLFASTVRLASERKPIGERPRQDWPASGPPSRILTNGLSKNKPLDFSSRGFIGSSPLRSARIALAGTAPTAWRKPVSARNNRERDGTASRTDVSMESFGGFGVPIRPWSLPRQDAIPCRVTGRRADHGGDNFIRVFVRLPGGSRFALWIPPDLPIGPVLPVPYDPLTTNETSWIRPAKNPGRLSPVRALLTQKMANLNCAGATDMIETVGVFQKSTIHSIPQSETSESLILNNSLKDLIEAATGISAERQKIIVGRCGPLEDATRPLHKYDIGHGATLLLSIKNPGTRQDVCYLASPALKKEFDTHHADCIFANMDVFAKSRSMMGGREAKDIVEPLPDWVDILPRDAPKAEQTSEIMFRDYMNLKDNHIFDKVGRIRKKFMS